MSKNFQYLVLLDDYRESKANHIIDVRSPAEFAEDHLPGAINLPVLDDAERHEVGLLYKSDAFAAKKRGAALISQNIANALNGPLNHQSKDFRPLIYCWRGGQRSMSLATVLTQIGWRCEVLNGGYRQYRRQVVEQINSAASNLSLIIINGLTGSGKTDLLENLHDAGAQVLDLENAAQHRGSVLGADPLQQQPAQKQFESVLAQTLAGFSGGRPVWIEAESNKIGQLHIPAALWRAMKNAPQIFVSAPVPHRVSYILSHYRHLLTDSDKLKELLLRLRHRVTKKQFDRWLELIDSAEWAPLVQSLLENYYDPAYSRSMARRQRQPLDEIHLSTMTVADFSRAAESLMTTHDSDATECEPVNRSTN